MERDVNYRITVEETCRDCQGLKNVASCSGCDGTGYQEITLTLAQFKDLLAEI